MRTPKYISMALRRPNGEIHITEKPFDSLTKKFKQLGVPIVRGIVGFVEMLVVGTKALNYSAEVFMEEEDAPKDEAPEDEKEKKLSSIYLFFTILFSIAFALFLFKFIPLWLTYQIENFLPIVQQKYVVFNLIDGLIKISMLVAYIAIISLMPDIKRVFQYHGAEHKSIYTYEKDIPLTPENAAKNSRFHPRCGTSFILIVFVISIMIYTFLPRHPIFWINLLWRIMMLPFIAGISYEFLKWSSKHQDKKYVLALSSPGLWMQRLTTREPEMDQLEIGLASLKHGLELEDGKIEAENKKQKY